MMPSVKTSCQISSFLWSLRQNHPPVSRCVSFITMRGDFKKGVWISHLRWNPKSSWIKPLRQRKWKNKGPSCLILSPCYRASVLNLCVCFPGLLAPPWVLCSKWIELCAVRLAPPPPPTLPHPLRRFSAPGFWNWCAMVVGHTTMAHQPVPVMTRVFSSRGVAAVKARRLFLSTISGVRGFSLPSYVWVEN